MGSTRTAWHVLLAALLRQRAPRRFQVQTEVPLATEPPRADYLFLRNEAPGASNDPAGTLRRLWDFLPIETIVEFKSVGRPYRSRNLDRLWGYLCLHYADAPERLRQRADLAGALLLPARTRSLDADVAALGFTWTDLGGGYWRLGDRGCALYVVELEVAAEAEGDDLLHFFGAGEARTIEARRWLAEQVGAEEIKMAMHEMEGFEELLGPVLAKLPPEMVQRLLAKLPPEVMQPLLAKLSPEQHLLGAPDEALRLLPDEYLRSLPADVQAAIRARIGRPLDA